LLKGVRTVWGDRGNKARRGKEEGAEAIKKKHTNECSRGWVSYKDRRGGAERYGLGGKRGRFYRSKREEPKQTKGEILAGSGYGQKKCLRKKVMGVQVSFGQENAVLTSRIMLRRS